MAHPSKDEALRQAMLEELAEREAAGDQTLEIAREKYFRLKELGESMRDRREDELQMSVAKAAKRAGIAPTTWRSLENGFRIGPNKERLPPSTPSDDTLMGIARALDLPAARVFEWAGRHYSPPAQLGHVAADTVPVSQLASIMTDLAEEIRALREELRRGREPDESEQ